MKNWLKELFGVEKPIIGMCHMMPLPGDPSYDNVKGMRFVYEQAKHDVIALQEGGVDGILFLMNLACLTSPKLRRLLLQAWQPLSLN